MSNRAINGLTANVVSNFKQKKLYLGSRVTGIGLLSLDLKPKSLVAAYKTTLRPY